MPYLGRRSQNDTQAFPWRQLIVLAICRICEPIAFMSIFPYIYYMIKSFHITDDDKRITVFAGLVTAAFAFAEAISSPIWGRISDKFGRKPILLCGLGGTGISMLAFGFGRNLQTLLIARALGGLLNGNIGVLQSTVAETIKVEAHQGFAFAIMPSVWCIGSVVGSALGGALADPVRSYPRYFRLGTIWDRYPYLLPNLVCAWVVVVGMVVGFLFLEETHVDKQEKRDVGLEIGRWIEERFRKASREELSSDNVDFTAETLALLHEDDLPPDYRSAAPSPDLAATTVGLPPPYHPLASKGSIVITDNGNRHEIGDIEMACRNESTNRSSSGVWNAFSMQVALNIISYGILAYHTISAEQLLPVLFSLPESNTQPVLPFWFIGGFALSTKSIGIILASQGMIQLVATLYLFPKVQRKLGTLTTYRLVVVTYPLLYLFAPYITLVPVKFRIPTICAFLLWKVTAQAWSFPAIQLMLNQTLPKRVRGTFNGFASSAASMARALGPTIAGLLEAAGLSRGMLGLPWWFTALIAMLGLFLSFFMAGQKVMSSDPEKEIQDDIAGPIPPAISPEINAALVAAESSNASSDNVQSRPTSPLLMGISIERRYTSRQDSKAQASA